MVNRRQAKKAAEMKAKVEKIVPEVKKVVEEIVPETEKVVEEKIVPEAKKVVEKAKKATTKKEMKTTLYVEYFGKQVQDKDMIAAVKKAWTKTGKKIGDIKTMALYVKPEENAVYYVINDETSGRVEF